MVASEKAAATPVPLEPRPSVGRLLSQVDRQLARRIESILADGHHLTLDQWRALDILADGEGRTMSELTALLVIPGATLTKVMDKLVDAALVYRRVDDRDRRRVVASLSEKGLALHSEMAPKVVSVEDAAMASLGEETTVLVALLARIAGTPVR